MGKRRTHPSYLSNDEAARERRRTEEMVRKIVGASYTDHGLRSILHLIDGYSLRFSIEDKTRCDRCKRWVLEAGSCPRCHTWLCNDCMATHSRQCKAIPANEEDFDDSHYDEYWQVENPHTRFHDLKNMEHEIPSVAEAHQARQEKEKDEILQWSATYDKEHRLWVSKEKEMGDRFREKQELSKDDLLQVLEWKFLLNPGRRRYELKLADENDDIRVRKISNDALRLIPLENSGSLILEGDAYRVDSLCYLNGVGPAVASTILAFYDPTKYCVFDYHVWNALFLERLDLTQDYTTENYLRLLLEVRYLAKRHGLNPRTVEKACFKKNFGKWEERRK